MLQQSNAPDWNPLSNQDIAIAKEHRIVRMDEFAWNKVGPWVAAQVRRVAISQLHNRLVVAIQNGDHALKVRNQHELFAEAEVAGQAHTIGAEFDVLSVK